MSVETMYSGGDFYMKNGTVVELQQCHVNFRIKTYKSFLFEIVITI